MKLHVPLMLRSALLACACVVPAMADVVTIPGIDANEGIFSVIDQGDVRLGGLVCITHDGSVTIEDNNSFTANSGGPAISINHASPATVTMLVRGNGELSFANKSNPRAYGGAIYSYSGYQVGPMLFGDNGKISFVGNSAAYGGAIWSHNMGITFSGNGDVLFEGNESKREIVGAYLYTGEGGAIYCSYRDLVFSANDSVTFSNNSGGGAGGAVYTGQLHIQNTANTVLFTSNHSGIDGGAACISYFPSGNILSLTDNNAIRFAENTAGGSGGAIYCWHMNTAEMRHNGNISFADNTAQGNGGAIALNPNSNKLIISGNTSLTFTANKAVSGTGGAIYTNQCSFSIIGNGAVSFIGNNAAAEGGAIDMNTGTIVIAGNTGDVTFSGNYVRLYDEDDKLTSIRLNSINYIGSGDITLAAEKGTTIALYDGMVVDGLDGIDKNHLNAYVPEGATERVVTGGDILFSGKDSEARLRKLWQEHGLDASGAAFAEALQASRTFEMNRINRFPIYLWGGRLRVEDGALFKGSKGFYAVEDSGAVLVLKNAGMDLAGRQMEFSRGTTLELSGTNTATGELYLHEGSSLKFNVGSTNLTTAALTLNGEFSPEGALNVVLASDEALTNGGSYRLLTLADAAAPGADVWNAELVSVSGLGADFNDLSWSGNTLYLKLAAAPEVVWYNTSGNGVWDTGTMNWKQNGADCAYRDGVSIVFGDAGAGDVALQGTHAPKNVLVNNSAGKDYRFTGNGSLAGSTTSLTKKGEGTLTIATSNSYGGGTVIEGGKLLVAAENALGSGSVRLNRGELNLGGRGLSNELLAQGGIISGGSGFRGSVVFNGAVGLRGNLSAASMRINQGSVLTLNGGTISVSGTLTLGGSAVLNLVGSDFGEGDVLINFGSLSGSEEQLSVDYGAESDKYTVEREGNALILALTEESLTEPGTPVPALSREDIDALVQSSWGVFTASHAFADTIGGQRSAAGYVGRGRSVAWVSALGGMHRIDGTVAASGSDIDLYGAAVGFEGLLPGGNTIGIAMGRLSGEVQLKQSDRQTEQDGTYIGVYGTHRLAEIDRRNSLNLKWSAVYGETETEYTIGQESVSPAQDSVQLNARLAWITQLSEAFCLSIFVGTEYFASDSAEVSSDTADAVRMGSIQNLRGEIGLSACMTSGSTTLYGEVRYLNDMVRSNPYADFNGIRGYGANPGRQGVGVTVGAQQELGGGWSVNAGYSLETLSEGTMHSANIGAALRF